jgi:hypothetical protein
MMFLVPNWFNYQQEGVLLGAALILVYLLSYFVLDVKSSKKLSGKAARSVYLRKAYDRIEKESQSKNQDNNAVYRFEIPYIRSWH